MKNITECPVCNKTLKIVDKSFDTKTFAAFCDTAVSLKTSFHLRNYFSILNKHGHATPQAYHYEIESNKTATYQMAIVGDYVLHITQTYDLGWTNVRSVPNLKYIGFFGKPLTPDITSMEFIKNYFLLS